MRRTSLIALYVNWSFFCWLRTTFFCVHSTTRSNGAQFAFWPKTHQTRSYLYMWAPHRALCAMHAPSVSLSNAIHSRWLLRDGTPTHLLCVFFVVVVVVKSCCFFVITASHGVDTNSLEKIIFFFLYIFNHFTGNMNVGSGKWKKLENNINMRFFFSLHQEIVERQSPEGENSRFAEMMRRFGRWTNPVLWISCSLDGYNLSTFSIPWEAIFPKLVDVGFTVLSCKHEARMAQSRYRFAFRTVSVSKWAFRIHEPIVGANFPFEQRRTTCLRSISNAIKCFHRGGKCRMTTIARRRQTLKITLRRHACKVSTGWC